VPPLRLVGLFSLTAAFYKIRRGDNIVNTCGYAEEVQLLRACERTSYSSVAHTAPEQSGCTNMCAQIPR
jgi:hypothetical protein